MNCHSSPTGEYRLTFTRNPYSRGLTAPTGKKGKIMSEEKTKDELAEVSNVEIEPLSDEDLDSVAGGTVAPDCTGCGTNYASCTYVDS